jgi:hypothetical protein
MGNFTSCSSHVFSHEVARKVKIRNKAAKYINIPSPPILVLILHPRAKQQTNFEPLFLAPRNIQMRLSPALALRLAIYKFQ